MAIASMVTILAFAQGTEKMVRVYEGNKVVFEQNYSDVDSIVFVDVDVPTTQKCALSGVFSVSATKKVNFSCGNLQASTTDFGEHWTWDFATNQWDYIGNAVANNAINGNGTVSANGIVDLFGWSTEATYYGIDNTNDRDYQTYTGDFRDWGEHIGEGWYTLSIDEWVYLFRTRNGNKASIVNGTTGIRFAKAKVNSVSGVILFPDGGTFNENEFTTVAALNAESSLEFTTCTANQWLALEEKGCVFLPAAGYRSCSYVYGIGSILGVYDVGSIGHYSSSTPLSLFHSQFVSFDQNYVSPQSNTYRCYGISVRLVREVQE